MNNVYTIKGDIEADVRLGRRVARCRGSGGDGVATVAIPTTAQLATPCGGAAPR